MDAVRISPDTFTMLMFMGAQARKEFTRERVPDAQKPQKINKDGVPVWSVQLSGVNWRGTPVMFSCTVPSHEDPMTVMRPGTPVELAGAVFGVTPKKRRRTDDDQGPIGNDYTLWCSADGLRPMQAAAKAS